jgi:endonuclease YncB( thermonuclease family)
MVDRFDGFDRTTRSTSRPIQHSTHAQEPPPMTRRRKPNAWWLLPVILAVGYWSRGRNRDQPTPDAPVALVLEKPAPGNSRNPSTETARDSKRIIGRVVSVHDGDTLTVLDETNTQIKVRLDAIDAPELGQPFGQAAKRALSEMVFGKDVVVIKKKEDRWGRTIGHVLIDGKDTNLLMLEAGMAWHYKEYDKNKRLAEAEIVAKEARIGLWRDGRAISPWDWRAAARTKRKVASP